MKSPRFSLGLVFALLTLAAAPLSHGQVIYDNIGNGNSYVPSAGYTIGFSSQQEVGVRFTAGSSLLLDYADLPVWNALSGSPFVNVGLLADGSGGKPGTLLEQVSVALPNAGSPLSLLHVEFSNTQFLTAGSVYWLAVSPADSTTYTAWEYTGRPFGTVAFDSGQIGFGDVWDGANTNHEAGMRIFGVGASTAVPEASTFGLVGSALLVGAIIFRRRFAKNS